MVAADFLTSDDGFGLWLMSPPQALLAGFRTACGSSPPGPRPCPDAVVIDFDVEGKHTRQERARALLGQATTISEDDTELLGHVLSLDLAPVLVRLSPYRAGHTEQLIRQFSDQGVSGFLMSMVQHESELSQARRALGSGVRLGAMIETREAINRIHNFRTSGMDFAFVGLVDLAIERGSASIFTPLIDGTMESISEALAGIPFGFGAATVVGGGFPLPNRLLLAEMVRQRASYTLLRSAFHRDVDVAAPAVALTALREVITELIQRTLADEEADSETLRTRLASILDRKLPEGL